MKKKMLIALICLSILLAVPGILALSVVPVASVGGVVYTSLQEAVDAAALGQTEADRVVLLLADVDLGDGTVVAQACDITLNLNGHAVTGTAEALIVLRDGARMVIADTEAGLGAIRGAVDGAGCAILVEDAGSSLVVNAGTLEAPGRGEAAVRCAAGATVVVTGGSVGGIASVQGVAAVQDEGKQEVVHYALTIGGPPLAGVEVTGLSTRPGPAHPYGSAVTNGSGVIHVWLPAGQTFISVRVGCTVYAGQIHGGNPYTAVLTEAGSRHDFSGAWQTDGAQHWKVCSRAGCGAEEYRTAHSGGTATCTEAAVCPVCGACYGEPLGHDFEDEFTVELAPACEAAGSQSRHCTRCGEVTEVMPILATGHSFSPGWTSNSDGHWHAATCGHDEIGGYAAHAGGTAACTEAAVCPVCGLSYGEPLGHNFETNFTVDIEPTCTEVGSKSRHCTQCEAVTDVTPIPGTGHSFSLDWMSDDGGHWHDSTCGHQARDGYAAHSGGTASCTEAAVCPVCGASYGEPLGHGFEDEFTVDVAPTCEAAGSKSRHCLRCDAVTGVTAVPATGHSFSTGWTSGADGHWHAATCGHGEIGGYAAHVGGAATCTEAAVCSVCGAPYGEPLGHNFETNFTVNIEPTCTKAGSKSRHCTRCDEVTGVTVIPAAGHVFAAGWTSDDDGHWHDASCGHSVTDGYAAHTGGEATCTGAAVCPVCGVPYGEPLGHNFETNFTVDIGPTCTEAGSQSRHCTHCDAVTGVTVIPASGHVFAANWTSGADGHWHAATCGHDETVGYAAHSGGAATCTETAVCPVCGASYGEPLGHEFEDTFTVDVEPTCTRAGSQSRHCTRCGEVTSVTAVPATGHYFSPDWESDASSHWHAATCGHDEIGGYAAHSGGAATCSETAVCPVCGASYGAPLGHDFEDEFTIDLAPTCEAAGSQSRHCARCGEVTGVTAVPAMGHYFSPDWESDASGHWHDAICGHSVTDGYAAHAGGAATCTEAAVCSVCGAPYGEPLGHEFEDTFTVDVEPTCTEAGSQSHHCTRCDEVTGVTVIPAAGHVFAANWTSGADGHWHAATCGHDEIDGYAAHTDGVATCTEMAVCAVCGAPYREPLGHDFEDEFTIDLAPTCEAAGRQSRHCTRCGEVTEVTEIPSTGHVFAANWTSDASGHWHAATCGHDEIDGYAAHAGGAATCTEAAVCPVCGAPYGEPLGHEFEDTFTVDVEPTCTGTGSKSHHCTRCDEVTGVTAVPATGHSFSSAWTSGADGHWHDAACGHSVTEGYEAHFGGTATCTEAAVCSVCGAPYGEPLGHDFGDEFTVDMAPTCTEAGSQSRHCTRCGEVTEVTSIPATGHSFSPEWSSDASGHWHDTTCGHDEIDGCAAHTPGADDGDCTTEVNCTVCGYAVVPATSHIWSAWQMNTTEHWQGCILSDCSQVNARAAHTGGTATCTEPALCSVCGVSYGAPLGHDFEAGFTIDAAPTCEAAGSQSRHCTRCDAVTEVTPIPATGHSFSPDWSSDASGHWHDTACGHDETDGYAVHTPGADDGDCTTDVSCIVCGYAVVPAASHIWSAWQMNTTEHWQGCILSGCSQVNARAAHTGGTATCIEPALCSVCGVSYGAPLGHDFEADFIIDIVPDCSNEGGKSRHCKRCDAQTDITPLPATDDHAFSDDWTSGEDGHWHAATCAHEDLISEYALHTPEADDGDCTTEVCCTVCGYEMVPAETEHFWGVMDTSLTEHWNICTNDGCEKTGPHAAHYGGEATCVEEAMCLACGDCYGVPLGHDFEADFTIDIVPDCGNEGAKSRHCTRCDEVTDVTPLPSLPHPFLTDWTYDETAHWHEAACGHGATDGYAAHSGGAATCTEEAVCPVCGASYGEPLGHGFEDEFTVDLAPTCTTAGSKSRQCTRCDEVTGVTSIPAAGHVFAADWTSGADGHWHAATCGHDEIDGYAAHSGGAATCTEAAVCTVCGASYGEPLGHEFESEFTLDLAPTCTTAGSQSRHCTRCSAVTGVTVIPLSAAAHNWGSWTTVTAATCTTAGSEKRFCTRNPAHIELREVAALGHSYATTYTTDVPATCTTAGTKSFHCTRCSAKSDVTAVEPLGHYWSSKILNTTATCSLTGTQTWYCGRCMTSEIRTTPIDIYAHSWGDWVTTAASTCSTPGTQQSTCLLNPAHIKTQSIAIDPDVHSWGAWAVATPATCMAQGVEKLTCLNNPAHIKTRAIAIDPAAHGWGAWMITTPPTCLATGTQKSTCIYNSAHTKTQTIAIDPTAHSWGGWTVIFPATCTTAGTQQRACLLNSAHLETGAIAIDSNAHNWGEWRVVTAATCVKAGLEESFCLNNPAHYGTRETPIDPEGHNWGEGWISDYPDCDPGKRFFICANKSSHGKEEIIPVTPHNHTLTIYQPANGTLTVTANGSAIASGTSLPCKTQVTATVVPDAGYQLDSLYAAHNVYLTPIAPGTWVIRDRNVHIGATMKRATYTITVSQSAGGTLSPGGEITVEHGVSQTITITPDAGYAVADVLVDGVSQGRSGSYTFHSVTAPHTIKAAFAPAIRISETHGEGGTITPGGIMEVPQGGSQTYTITPNEGYHIVEVKVDGDRIDTVGSYTFSNVTAQHIISAKFERNVYTVSFDAMTNGSVRCSPGNTAPYGATVTLNVDPAINYQLKAGSLKVNGTAIAGTTFTMPAQDVTISAEFELRQYAITIQTTGNGTVTASHSSAAFGTKVTLTVTPADGHRLVAGSLKGNGTEIRDMAFLMPTKDVVVTASFEPIP